MVKKKGLFLIAGLFSTLMAIFVPSTAMAMQAASTVTDVPLTGSSITNIVMSVYTAPGSTAPQTGDNPLWVILTALAVLAAIVSFGLYLKTRYVPKHAAVSIKSAPIMIVAAIGVGLALITAGVGIANAANGEGDTPTPVSEQMQVLTADDGSEYHFGDAPYSNVQAFTNTSPDYTIALTKISLISTGKVDNIGNWHCTLTAPDGTEYDAFNGGMGSYTDVKDSYMLAPGESYTLTWSTSLTAKELKELGNVTPAFIQYDYDLLENEFVGVVTKIDTPKAEYADAYNKVAAEKAHPYYTIEYYYDAKVHKTEDNMVEVLPRNAKEMFDWFYHAPENDNVVHTDPPVSEVLASDYVIAAYVAPSVKFIPDLTSTTWMFSFPMLAYLEGINNVNMSNVTDARNMFCGCSVGVLRTADPGGFDTYEEYCNFIETYYVMNALDVSQFDTKNLVNAEGMFSAYNGSNLEKPNFTTQSNTGDYKRVVPKIYAPVVVNFDTDNVEDMSYMFYAFPATMNAPVVDTWNTSNVTTMKGMFREYGAGLESAPNLTNSLDVPDYIPTPNMLGWDVSNVTDMKWMFYNYGGGLLKANNTNAKDFDGLVFDFSTWDTTNVDNWNDMLSTPFLYQFSIGKNWDLDFKTALGSDMYSWWKNLNTGIKYGPEKYSEMPTNAQITYQRTEGEPELLADPIVDNAPAANDVPEVKEDVPIIDETPAVDEVTKE